ncbi:MAG: 2-succinyl-5-enolpyruvyl-6-hydroxy-3-cyclohexene-1-carboxylic-acid synthase [Lacisediminihabitans sp.]
MPGASPATDFSVALLAEFVRCGVRDVVLSPGSRSQAIALAAAEYEAAGVIRLHVRIDERVAGFLALGIAVETRTPVLVVTTSGTAVANLHPAALEAHHSGVPLILLTADRPVELRGIGSNQTTDQLGIFGVAVEWCRDVEAPSAASSGAGFDSAFPGELAHEAYSAAAGHSSAPGPVQLNLAFREPLSGRIGALPTAAELVEHPRLLSRERERAYHDRGRTTPDGLDTVGKDLLDQRDAVTARPHTVVIAGHGAGERAEEAARALGAPLLAEVSSGSHFGPNLVVAYRLLLNDEDFGGRVERAVVFGHPTLSREIPALLQRDGVEVIGVRGPSAVDYNPGHRVSRFVDAVEVSGEPDSDRSWLGSWVHTSRRLLDERPEVSSYEQSRPAMAITQMETFREPVTRRMLVEAVWRVTWPHDRLILGASRLIREADAVIPGKRISVHANRGLAGIDGTVSTGLGIALASQSDAAAAIGVTRVLLGDLALLHDVGALLFGVGEPRPTIQVIVGNDGGGTIFDGLEVAASARAEAFDRVLFTPQVVDLRALAEAYGWRYLLAANRGELDEALSASDGPTLIEVPLQR